MNYYGIGLYTVDVRKRISRRHWEKLLSSIEKLPQVAPNSMNKYGRVLAGASYEIAQVMQRMIIAPLAKHAYSLPAFRPNPHAFVVEYTTKTQRTLAMHMDSSDVTLNLCLGGIFSGGDLVFYQDGERIQLPQVPGWAVIHRGSLLHRAMSTVGARSNLVIWSRVRGSKFV